MSWTVIGIWTICLSPIWGTLVWFTWAMSIKPRLIPVGDIKALADEMITKHGPRAEEMAFIEEDRTWRYSDSFQQGKWRRVRKELWRRYRIGSGVAVRIEGEGLLKCIKPLRRPIALFIL